MRCREVKRRMIEADDRYDRELIEHLRSCPSCANAAEAADVLKELLARDKTEEPIPTFDEFRTRVEASAERQSSLEKIMSITKLFIFSRPKLAASLSLAMIFFLFIMLIPFSYTSVAGYKITAPISGKVSLIEQRLLETAIAGIGFDGVTVTVSEQPRQYLIAGLPTRGDAEALAVIIKNLIALKSDPSVEPIQTVASGTIYAQALEKVKPEENKETKLRLDKDKIYLNDFYFDGAFFNSEVSDAEIKSRVEKIMAERDFEPGQFNVSCSTVSDGSRIVSIGIPTEGNGKKDEFRFDIKTDRNKNLQYAISVGDKPVKIKRNDGKMNEEPKEVQRLILKFGEPMGNGRKLIFELSSDSTRK